MFSDRKKFGVLIIFTLLLIGHHPAMAGWRACFSTHIRGHDSEQLMQVQPLDGSEALNILRSHQHLFNMESKDQIWRQTVRENVLNPDFHHRPNVTVTIIGPESSGKSILFNSIPSVFSPEQSQNEISSLHFSQGPTARPVVMVRSDQVENLVANQNLQLWTSSNDSAEDGAPLVFGAHDFYQNLTFIDTPSFDRVNLETIGLLSQTNVIIYLFTDTTHRNAESIRNLRTLLDHLEDKKLILVQRIPENMAMRAVDQNFEELLRTIITDDLTSNQILGMYRMIVRSEKDQSPQAQLLPQKDSPEFSSLLLQLDQSAPSILSPAAAAQRANTLERMEKLIKEKKRIVSADEYTRNLFSRYIERSVEESLARTPYDRLGSELEEVWSSRAQGARNFSRWLAHPVRMLRGRTTELTTQGEGFQVIATFMNSMIDQVVVRFQLAASKKIVRLQTGSKLQLDMEKEMQEFRQAYHLQPGEPPESVERGSYTEYSVPSTPWLNEGLYRMTDQDWRQVSQSAREQSQANLANLVILVQADLAKIADQQGKIRRAIGQFYSFAAIVPTVAALSYMTYRSTIADVQSLLSLFGANILARAFVRLDDENLKAGWNKSIEDWFNTRQSPRLIEILQSHLKVKGPIGDQTAISDLDLVLYAIETLKKTPP